MKETVQMSSNSDDDATNMTSMYLNNQLGNKIIF